MAVQDTLKTAQQNLANALVLADLNPQPTYTIAGEKGSRTVDWNTYRDGLVSQINELTTAIRALDQLNNAETPYNITSVQVL